MNPGILRHRGVLQGYTEATDSKGQQVKTWYNLASIWMAVQPQSGSEYANADSMVGQTIHRVITRWRADITSTKRIKFGDRILEIVEVLNDRERNAEMVLTCRESR